MIDKGKPLYMFYTHSLRPYVQISYSDNKVIKYCCGDESKTSTRDMSELRHLPATGDTENDLSEFDNHSSRCH